MTSITEGSNNAPVAKVTHRLGRLARFQFSMSLLRMATESVTSRRGRVCSPTPGMPKVEPCNEASSQVKQRASFAQAALHHAATNMQAATVASLHTGGELNGMSRHCLVCNGTRLHGPCLSKQRISIAPIVLQCAGQTAATATCTREQLRIQK